MEGEWLRAASAVAKACLAVGMLSELVTVSELVMVSALGMVGLAVEMVALPVAMEQLEVLVAQEPLGLAQLALAVFELDPLAAVAGCLVGPMPLLLTVMPE